MCGDIVDLGHLVVDHEEFFLGTGDVVKRFTTVVLVIDDDAVEREFFLGTIVHVHIPILLEEREPCDVTQITKFVRRRVLVHAQVLELDRTQELVQMIQIGFLARVRHVLCSIPLFPHKHQIHQLVVLIDDALQGELVAGENGFRGRLDVVIFLGPVYPLGRIGVMRLADILGLDGLGFGRSDSKKILGPCGFQDDHIVVQIKEMLGQAGDLVQEILDRDGIKCGQVLGGDDLLVRNDHDLVVIRIQKIGELVITNDKEDLADKRHIGLDGTQAVLDLVVVIETIVTIVLTKGLDLFHELGMIAVDPCDHHIDGQERA